MTPSEITELVNAAYKGVDDSQFGPIVQFPDPNDVLNKQINQVAFGVFTIVLTGMLKK